MVLMLASSASVIYSHVEVLFANGEFEKAREQVAHMKYYANVLDKIFEKETEFGMY